MNPPTSETATEHIDETVRDKYVTGDLSRARRSVIERHLGRCDACWEQVKMTESLIAAIEAWGGHRRTPFRTRPSAFPWTLKRLFTKSL